MGAPPTNPGRAAPTARLGLWWPCAVVGVVGLVVWVATGHIVLGASIVAGGFLLAAGLRAARPDGRVGALQVRSRALDIAGCVAAAVNVLGAAAMVGRHIPWQLLGAVNLVLLAIIAAILFADSRVARERYWAKRGGRPDHLG
nr:DUF3017 domain-containing protein [Kineosphaera limosa]